MPKEMSLSVEDMIETLENDEDFRTLKQKYESPNGFTIMGNKRREEWHSSFVSWLLNPKQNHKLGTFPIEKFLKLIESKKTNLEIDKTDIADINFETEHLTNDGRRIDIFGVSRSLLVVIENKIKANETFSRKGIPQSSAYYEYCEETYKDKQRYYILLKARPDSTVALDDKYIHITYQELFDNVINPALKRSHELKLEDTNRVLEQYSLDISNPFTSIALANTQKDISDKIYKKHKQIIEKIRITLKDTDVDNESQICKFFYKNEEYINNIILNSLGKPSITPGTIKKLKGKELCDALLDYGYIIPNQTELIYKFKSKTCIIMVDENRKYYTGHYNDLDYDGSQEVDAIGTGFETLRDAQLAVEGALGSQNINGGKSAYELKLINSGKKDAEGKMIKEVLELL